MAEGSPSRSKGPKGSLGADGERDAQVRIKKKQKKDTVQPQSVSEPAGQAKNLGKFLYQNNHNTSLCPRRCRGTTFEEITEAPPRHLL